MKIHFIIFPIKKYIFQIEKALLEHKSYAYLTKVVNGSEMSERAVAVVQSDPKGETAEIAVVARNIVPHPKK